MRGRGPIVPIAFLAIVGWFVAAHDALPPPAGAAP